MAKTEWWRKWKSSLTINTTVRLLFKLDYINYSLINSTFNATISYFVYY